MPASLEGFVRSITRGMAEGPRSRQTCFSFSPARSMRKTFAPADRIALAHARPMPEAAPVTAAIFPLSSSFAMVNQVESADAPFGRDFCVRGARTTPLVRYEGLQVRAPPSVLPLAASPSSPFPISRRSPRLAQRILTRATCFGWPDDAFLISIGSVRECRKRPFCEASRIASAGAVASKLEPCNARPPAPARRLRSRRETTNAWPARRTRGVDTIRRRHDPLLLLM